MTIRLTIAADVQQSRRDANNKNQYVERGERSMPNLHKIILTILVHFTLDRLMNTETTKYQQKI